MNRQKSSDARRRAALRRRESKRERDRKQNLRGKSEERRQERIAAPLHLAQGQMRMARIDKFLSGYRHNPVDTGVIQILDDIWDLNLLRNRQHLATMAAAVVALTTQHPDAVWLRHKTVQRALTVCPLATMERILDPSDEDLEAREGGEQMRPVQVLQAMVWWLVTGDLRYAQEVYNQAYADPPNEEALDTLLWYVREYPDLRRWFRSLRPTNGDAADRETVDEDALERIREAIPAELRSKVTYIVEDDSAILVGVMERMATKTIRRGDLKQIVIQTSLPSIGAKIRRAVEQGGEP